MTLVEFLAPVRQGTHQARVAARVIEADLETARGFSLPENPATGNLEGRTALARLHLDVYRSKVDPATFGNTVNSGVAGTNNIGVTGNPKTGGSGLNLFANPEDVYNQFRRVNISTDGRAGRANPLRGLPRWNLDASVGKKTNITEKVNVVFAADFFNILNKVDFANPGCSTLTV